MEGGVRSQEGKCRGKACSHAKKARAWGPPMCFTEGILQRFLKQQLRSKWNFHLFILKLLSKNYERVIFIDSLPL